MKYLVELDTLKSSPRIYTELPMIDRQGLKILFECDSCDEVFISEEHEEFDDVWAQAKRNGWSCRKIAGEWLHGCPSCGVPT